MRWAGHVTCVGERRNAYRVLVGKPEGRRHLEEPGIDERIILNWIFKKCDVKNMDWFHLAQDRDRCGAVVNAVMNLRVP
jgi:hypothetical protein